MRALVFVTIAWMCAACSGGVSSDLFDPQAGGGDAGESADGAEGGSSLGVAATGEESANGSSQGGGAGAGFGSGFGSGFGGGLGSAGGTQGAGGGASTDTGGETGTTATGGSCGVALGTGSAACDCCVAEACTPDDTACANDGPCVAAVACVKECNGYADCVEDCEFDNPSSQAEMLLSCAQFSCMSACAGFYGAL